MSLSWRNAKLPDAPHEHIAFSEVGEGWFWIAYPASSTTWKLQLIRGDLTEYPLRDDASLSFEDVCERAQGFENRLLDAQAESHRRG